VHNVPEDLQERFASLCDAITATIQAHPEKDCILIAWVLSQLGACSAGNCGVPLEALLPIMMQSYVDGATGHQAGPMH
jgi:hypothetical protein